MSNQLSEAKSYNIENMIFSEPINGSIPNSTIQFKRIMVKTKYPSPYLYTFRFTQFKSSKACFKRSIKVFSPSRNQTLGS